MPRTSSLLTDIAELRLQHTDICRRWEHLEYLLSTRSGIADPPGGRGGYNNDQPRVPAGSSDGGQWTDGGGGSGARVQPALVGPIARVLVPPTIRLGLMLYTYLSGQNITGSRTIAEFNSREFRPGEEDKLLLDDVRQLNRSETEKACPRLPIV